MQAQTKTLPRMKFEGLPQIESEDPRVELAKQAASLLGYGNLAKVVTRQSGLLAVLRELDIAPLVPQHVEQYRKKKAKNGMWSGTKRFLTMAPSSILGVLGTAYLRHITGSFDAPTPPGVACFILGIVSIVLSVITIVEFAGEVGRGRRMTRFWDSCDIRNYQGSVPEFALSKAVQIKQALPQAEIRVSYLVEKKEEKFRPMPDPFLIAQLGSEIHYIDVWDEKEYESRYM